MGLGLYFVAGHVPKRAVHLSNIDWTGPDHGNITHGLLNQMIFPWCITGHFIRVVERFTVKAKT